MQEKLPAERDDERRDDGEQLVLQLDPQARLALHDALVERHEGQGVEVYVVLELQLGRCLARRESLQVRKPRDGPKRRPHT